MGSNQSAAGESGSFSIDPSGNVTHKYSSEKTADQKQSSTGRRSRENRDDADDNSFFASAPPPTPALVSMPVIATQQEAPTSSRSSKQQDGLNLAEADDIVTRMKAKYKPNSREMAGKQKSIFEEVERNLASCYRKNKDQPLKCLDASEQYREYVREQRSQILKTSMQTNVPLVATILLVVACVLMQLVTPISCYGAMSIDLGSEWMKVGLVAPKVQMDIVLNAQSQRKTPMAVAFSNGERFIGEPALDIASKYPERTFTHFLDLVGKTIDDESVKHYKQRFPYADISSHEPNSTSIILNHPEGLSFTPLELIAMMFEHAHDQVASRLNSNEPAGDVVVAVPPFFNDKEKQVILDAAKIVGLNVLRLTNVNSAFALSYGIYRHKDYLPEASDNRTSILFFDQGASQTSATLADYHLIEQFDEATGISKNETLPTVTIRAQVYDRFLGGFDMQLKLRDYLIDTFAKENKMDKAKIYKRGRSASKVLKEAGKVKRVLSANTEYLARIENVIDDKDFRHPISRQQFEDLNKDLMEDRVISLLDKLYEMPDVSRDEKFESVIIVGGNTRTPKLQQVLMDYFKLDVLGKSINADEGAALAALYQAASLGRGFRVKKFALEEFGQERKRYDPSKVKPTTTTTTTTTVAPEVVDGTTSTTTTTSSTTTPAPATREPVTPNPNAIYGASELARIGKKLARLREQDYLRLQRLSLMNSLESLLSEGRQKLDEVDNNEESGDVTSDSGSASEQFKAKRSELELIIKETYYWLEEGHQVEKDNVTLLAEKYTSLYDLVHPRPPPTQKPEPTVEIPFGFNLSDIDFAEVLNNSSKSILEALGNLTGKFTRPVDEEESQPLAEDKDRQQQQQPPAASESTPAPSAGGDKTPDPLGAQQATTPPPAPQPTTVKKEPPHSEL